MAGWLGPILLRIRQLVLGRHHRIHRPVPMAGWLGPILRRIHRLAPMVELRALRLRIRLRGLVLGPLHSHPKRPAQLDEWPERRQMRHSRLGRVRGWPQRSLGWWWGLARARIQPLLGLERDSGPHILESLVLGPDFERRSLGSWLGLARARIQPLLGLELRSEPHIQLLSVRVPDSVLRTG